MHLQGVTFTSPICCSCCQATVICNRLVPNNLVPKYGLSKEKQHCYNWGAFLAPHFYPEEVVVLYETTSVATREHRGVNMSFLGAKGENQVLLHPLDLQLHPTN